MQIPLDKKINELTDIPYTFSFVIKKRIQVDSLNELPKEKRPTDDIIWNGNQDDLDKWLDKVLNRKKDDKEDGIIFDLSKLDIEG